MPELTRAQGDAIQRARAQLHHGFASMWPDDALALLATLYSGGMVEVLQTSARDPLVEAINDQLALAGVPYVLTPRVTN